MTSLSEPHYAGTEWQQTAEKKATGILDQELRRRGWKLEELKRRRKGDLEKIKCGMTADFADDADKNSFQMSAGRAVTESILKNHLISRPISA